MTFDEWWEKVKGPEYRERGWRPENLQWTKDQVRDAFNAAIEAAAKVAEKDWAISVEAIEDIRALRSGEAG